MKLKNYLIAGTLLFSVVISAQEKVGPTNTGRLQGPIVVPSLAKQIQNGTFKRAEDHRTTIHPKRKLRNTVVPGKGTPASFVDPLVALQENAATRLNKTPIVSFDAAVLNGGGAPSDPTGAVGTDHYIASWNSAFRIFDKTGTPLTDAASLNTIFPGNATGDPIVFFDDTIENGPGEPNGRFVITEFSGLQPGGLNGFDVAVCQGPDPVNDGWHVYSAEFGTGAFPDYTKFAVGPDGYYVTANIGSASRLFVVERNEMINGDPAQFVALPLPGISTSGFYSPHAFNTTGELAPSGTPMSIVYMADDAWGGVSNDELRIWNVTVDWNTTSNSAVSQPQIIDASDGLLPFIGVFDGGSFSNLDQPSGPKLDAMQATIMNQAQYRRFGTHNSAVFNFVVDVVSSPGQGLNEKAGIRWFELRQTTDGEPWTIYQQGTYTSPTGNKDAWAASMAMNANGDIGMGYSTVSDTEMISIQYTGRLATDPINIMTAGENLIVQSTANNVAGRYADYTHLTPDPVDGSFWHNSEYNAPGSGIGIRDRVGQFRIEAAEANDIGVISIDSPVDGGTYTDSEDIVITIRNFGTNDITNPGVQYSVNGGPEVIENYSGVIASATSVSFTFTQTADLSAGGNFIIDSKTNMDGDSNPQNDPFKVSINGDPVLSVTENTIGENEAIDNAKLIITSLPNDQFDISLKTSFDGILAIDVIDVTGQTVAFNNIQKDAEGYNYKLNMSYAASGMYLIRVGDQSTGVFQTGKIIIK